MQALGMSASSTDIRTMPQGIMIVASTSAPEGLPEEFNGILIKFKTHKEGVSFYIYVNSGCSKVYVGIAWNFTSSDVYPSWRLLYQS